MGDLNQVDVRKRCCSSQVKQKRNVKSDVSSVDKCIMLKTKFYIETKADYSVEVLKEVRKRWM